MCPHLAPQTIDPVRWRRCFAPAVSTLDDFCHTLRAQTGPALEWGMLNALRPLPLLGAAAFAQTPSHRRNRATRSSRTRSCAATSITPLRRPGDRLQDNPRHVRGRLLLATALIGERNFADAHVVLDRLALELPQSPAVWFELGVLSLTERSPGRRRRRVHERPCDQTHEPASDQRWRSASSASGPSRRSPFCHRMRRLRATVRLSWRCGAIRRRVRAATRSRWRSIRRRCTGAAHSRTAGDLWTRTGETQGRAGKMTDDRGTPQGEHTTAPGCHRALDACDVA